MKLFLLCVLHLITLVSGNDYFSKGVGNLLSVVQDTLDGFQSYVGERDGCRFTCPNGSKAKPNPRHQKSSNGCGAFGFNLEAYLSIETLTKCCNVHDLCYDTCNSHKRTCDDSFKECLKNLCHKMKKVVIKDVYDGCKSTADMIYATTVALGCKPYKESQKTACLCEPTRTSRREL